MTPRKFRKIYDSLAATVCCSAVSFLFAAQMTAPMQAFAYIYLMDSPTGTAGTVVVLDEATLMPIAGSPFESVPDTSGAQVQIAMSPSGTRVYAPAFMRASKVAVFDVSPTTGALTPIMGSPFSDTAGGGGHPFATPFGVAVSPDGSVYLTNFGNDLFFKLTADLDFVEERDLSMLSSPMSNPTSIAINQAGTLVYVVDAGSGQIARFNANLSDLTPLMGSTGSFSSYGVAIHPDETYVYSTNTDGTVTRFDPDLSNPITASLGPIGSLAIVVDPDGSEVYVCNQNGTVFVLDSVTLATITSFSSEGFTPYVVAIDPAGERIYTANAGSGTLSVRDLVHNSFPVIAGSPFAVAESPFGMAFTPQQSFPPSNFSGQQRKNNFGLIFELVNELEWEAPSSGEVAGYYLYRNDEKIATLSASTFTYQDHNIQKGVSTFYSISSFDAGNNESDPIDLEVR